MDQKDYRTGFLQLQGLRGCATKPVWGVFTEDPVMRKALLCYVLDVSGCDLKPGTVLGLGWFTQQLSISGLGFLLQSL